MLLRDRETIRKFKINGLPKDSRFNQMPFGQQLDGLRKIQSFKLTAKVVHLSQKRQSYAKAIRDAIRLYDVDEYFCQFACGEWRKDDSFEFFYTTKN